MPLVCSLESSEPESAFALYNPIVKVVLLKFSSIFNQVVFPRILYFMVFFHIL